MNNIMLTHTVEFLVSGDEFFFIEVNPRVQVEHTITEMITGIDIVKTQILVFDGANLFDERVSMPQEEIQTLGYAIQCRITTEDPSNDFMPDSGTIIAYRSSGGFGVRLNLVTVSKVQKYLLIMIHYWLSYQHMRLHLNKLKKRWNALFVKCVYVV